MRKVLVFVLFLFGCNLVNPFWAKVQEKVNAGQQEILLHEITDFQWDTVCVLAPYSVDIGGKNARLTKLIPHDIGEFENNIPDLNDDALWAFAFIKDGKVIAIEKKGSAFYFHTDHELPEKNCLDNKSAKFVYATNFVNQDDYLVLTNGTLGD